MNLQEKSAPLIEELYVRWDALNQRERMVVTALGVVLIFAVIMVGIYVPLTKKRDEAILRYQTNVELLGWMSSVAPQVIKLSDSEGTDQPAQSIMSTVNQTAQAYQLNLNRIQPEGENNLRVWVQDASFDAMMRWLADLQNNSNIIVNNISIDGGGNTGIVSARVVLSGS